MHKKFDINRTKIKGGCQSGRKVVTHNKSDLPLTKKPKLHLEPDRELEYFKILQRYFKDTSKILQNTSKYFKILQDTTKYFKIHQKPSKYFKDTSKYFKNTSKILQKHFKI